MALEVSGKLFKLLNKQTGEGKNGPWTKQDFILETTEQYPKKICFSAWGDRVNEITNLSEGTQMKVSFDVASREYNERWYTDLRPWKIEVTGATAAPPANHSPVDNSFAQDSNQPEDDLPF